MNIGHCVRLSLMGSCKLHAALSVDVLHTKICSDSFNGSEHPLSLSRLPIAIYLSLIYLRATARAILEETTFGPDCRLRCPDNVSVYLGICTVNLVL